MRKCPCCGEPAKKALLGPFKVNLCFCKEGSWDEPVVFGFWVLLAAGLADLIAPKQNMVGHPCQCWAFFVYEGCYLKALWTSMFAKGVQHG